MVKSTTLSDPILSPSAEFLANPYPTLARLRQEAPVYWSEKGNYWLLTRYGDVHEVVSDRQFEKGVMKFKNTDLFVKLFPVGDLLEFREHSMLLQNPPDHTRLRGLVNKAFTPSMVAGLKPRIEAITNELLEGILSKSAKSKEFDLIAEMAYPLPATVIAEMLGIPTSDREKFKVWSHNITAALDPNPQPNLLNIAKVAGAYKDLIAYLRPLVADRRKERKNDLISALVAAEEDGNHLSETELLANIVLLLIAGHETTTNLIGNGMLALLRNPDQLELLKSKPDLMPTAIDEFLRYDSPVQMVRRIAADNFQIGDTTIKSGQHVVPLIGAANHDPDQFKDPETLDITREDNKHISFGHGIHHCLGWSLAGAEGQIAISALLKTFPNIKMKTQKIEVKLPFSLRGVKQLHVTY